MNSQVVFRVGVALAIAAVVLDGTPTLAGMPAPPPLREIVWPSGLTTDAKMRLQTLSFFGVVLLLSALAVRWVWNALRPDFPRLPHLSYPKALGLVGLWGLLFLLVLTMISGARELMTPGAWKRDGATYALATDPKAPAGPTEDDRRARLERLAVSLARYTDRHGGAFPESRASADIPAERWATLHPSGMAYVYVSGRTKVDGSKVVACEPDVFGGERFALTAAGDITRHTSAELAARLAAEDDE